MAHVVFLRAANVGGRNVFKPAEVAKALAHLDVVNVGAVGTFVVRGRTGEPALRREIAAHLPFTPRMVVVPGRDLLALVAAQPFAGVALSRDLRGWAAPFAGRPTARPVLPHAVPAGRQWAVRLERVEGTIALGTARRRPGVSVYPNAVVEKALGVEATTRWWETIERVAALLA